ncbi:hypothetical protein [Mucilaginibacter ginsenosidivorax]|uniref:Uncharacterized protein n=1 Tax=Mucilaginibacter ginsenosidivorax TaxID=862126 RepID=A0A5B8W1A7_9SPHI|nr:hypothetical protein [Mucilaginibacter ginsenosidivorax]QEC76685.1 hypothetical protein FSB76_12260 [Mucilaginibacter ginsenosidivorax]
MNIFNTIGRKEIAVALFLFTGFNVYAQQNNEAPKPVAGKTYLKQTIVKSESTLQNGTASVNISSSSAVTKTYNFEASYGNSLKAKVVTTQITDTINSGKDHFYFSSNKPADTSGQLSAALRAVVGAEDIYILDGQGNVAGIQKSAPVSVVDSIMSFAGLEREELTVGKKFPLIVDIAKLKDLEPSKRWGDTVSDIRGKTVGEYWLQSNNKAVTVLAFIKTTNDDKLNTHSTGTYTIDNASGIVLKREIQHFTTGYQMFQGKPFISTRRSTVTEICSLVD